MARRRQAHRRGLDKRAKFTVRLIVTEQGEIAQTMPQPRCP
jgi:hypothetical protein